MGKDNRRNNPALVHYTLFNGKSAYISVATFESDLRRLAQSSGKSVIDAYTMKSNFFCTVPTKRLADMLEKMNNPGPVMLKNNLEQDPEDSLALAIGTEAPTNNDFPKVLENFMHSVVHRQTRLNSKGWLSTSVDVAIQSVISSMFESGVLNTHDKIGIMTPTSPSIMSLAEIYGLTPVYINEDELDAEDPTYDHSILSERGIKIMIMENPNSFTGELLDDPSLFVNLVENNLDILFIVVSTLAPFITKDHKDFGILPSDRVISVFSMSEYLGTPGLNTTLVTMTADNHIVDRKVSINCTSEHCPPVIGFLSRVRKDAESRCDRVSTIQRLITTIGAEYSLKDQSYIETVRTILFTRNEIFREALHGVPRPAKDSHSCYVSTFNALELAYELTNDRSQQARLKQSGNSGSIEFARVIAQRYGILIAPGPVFGGNIWDFRIVLANVDDDELTKIADAIEETIRNWTVTTRVKTRRRQRNRILV